MNGAIGVTNPKASQWGIKGVIAQVKSSSTPAILYTTQEMLLLLEPCTYSPHHKHILPINSSFTSTTNLSSLFCHYQSTHLHGGLFFIFLSNAAALIIYSFAPAVWPPFNVFRMESQYASCISCKLQSVRWVFCFFCFFKRSITMFWYPRFKMLST